MISRRDILIDEKKLMKFLEDMIDERTAKKIDANNMKIDVLKEKKKPNIVIDTTGTKNVNPEDVALAVNQINQFIMVADIQIRLIEDIKTSIEQGVFE